MKTKRILVTAAVLLLTAAACQAAVQTSPGPTATPARPAATATPTAAPTPTPAPTRTPVPTPTPLPTAYTVEGATSLSGTAHCRQVESGTETGDEKAGHGRGFVYECRYTVNDPRLDGAERLTFNYDVWGDRQAVLAVQWGEGRLETGGGTWEGTWSGVVLPGLRDEITLWYRGSGGYDGLTLYLRVTGSAGDYDVEGLIFPAELPPH